MRGCILTARWAQDGDKLHLVGSMPGGVIDKKLVITVADAVACSYRGDQKGSFRRCNREEMQVSEPMDTLDAL